MANASSLGEFGSRLRQHRLEAGLTQEALAERAGLGVRSVQSLERGQSTPRRDTAQRLATALGLVGVPGGELEALAGPAPRHRQTISHRLPGGQGLCMPSADAGERGGPDDRWPTSLGQPGRETTRPGGDWNSPELPLGNLPVSLTSFVGREREIAEVERLLERTRLLTLTGTGGCGKTRLAVQAVSDLLAERQDAYPDGVWFVDLAPLSEPSLVAQTVAFALGLRDVSGEPILVTLRSHLMSKSLLLLVDNCEHLLDTCARLVDELLRSCPHLQVLATSREMLGVEGEIAWRVPSMAVPDPSELPPVEVVAGYESVRLLVERGRLVRPSFSVTPQNASAVARVCWRLDGIPLALELAAARLAALSIEQVASRLGDTFRLLAGGSRTTLRRQQTLRATIDWSYVLLSEPERVLFRRLAVFAGGWSLEAAERVCPGRSAAGEGIVAEDVLDLHSGLVRKSLIVVEERGAEDRYRLPEPIRQYALERLAESGEGTDVRNRHRDWCLDLVRSIEEAGLQGPDSGDLLDQLEREHDNLRTALSWCLETDPAVGLRLAVGQTPRQWGGVFALWMIRGYPTEGRRWLKDLLEAAPERSWARSLALTNLSFLVADQGDELAAETLVEEALSIARETGDPMTTACAMLRAGLAAHLKADHARARILFGEARSIGVRLGEVEVTGRALQGLGYPAAFDGNFDEAKALLEEGVRVCRAGGADRVGAFILCQLGAVSCEVGDLERGRACFEEGIAFLRKVRSLTALGMFLPWFGFWEGHGGDYPRGISILRESLRVLTRLGHRPKLRDCLYSLGVVEVHHGLWRRGVRLAASAEADGTVGWLRNPSIAREMDAARAILGEEAFARAYAEGQAMTVEQAVEYALAE